VVKRVPIFAFISSFLGAISESLPEYSRFLPVHTSFVSVCTPECLGLTSRFPARSCQKNNRANVYFPNAPHRGPWQKARHLLRRCHAYAAGWTYGYAVLVAVALACAAVIIRSANLLKRICTTYRAGPKPVWGGSLFESGIAFRRDHRPQRWARVLRPSCLCPHATRRKSAHARIAPARPC